jgi:hypothetical protein
MKNNVLLKAVVILIALAVMSVPGHSANAANAVLPTLPQFAASLINGQPGTITGVYVPDLFAYPVVAQPVGLPAYVDTHEGVVTRFGMAEPFNVIGLLAHNNLAGAIFSSLVVNQRVYIVYGDGHWDTYIVNGVSRFQALVPNSPNSDFLDTATQQKSTAGDIFNRFYTGGSHITFQTCIANNGVASWGRLFVTAVPVLSYSSSFLRDYVPVMASWHFFPGGN